MVGKALLLVLLCLIFRAVPAQTAGSAEKAALRDIERQRWDKAETRLRKSLTRDVLNPPVRYALSLFYLDPSNPDYNLDSAYHYAVGALSDFAATTPRTREKLKRLSLDSARLTNLRAKIDSTAFQVARENDTEIAYIEFLNHFPSAVQGELAAELRDEVAFQEAVKESTPQALRRYLNRYPHSRRAGEAQQRLDRLLFNQGTSDKRLASYEKFLEDYPETPYRAEIWQNIFGIVTAEGTVDAFLSFIDRYPKSELTGRAMHMMFHLLADEEEPEWPAMVLNDSLRHLLDLNKSILIPFFTTDRYGFMTETGEGVIDPRYQRIHDRYLCGNITDDVLIVDDQVVARNGAPVYNGAVIELIDLGAGLLKITTSQGTSIIHKAGFLIRDTVEDARVLSKRFVAIKKESFWYLHTLSGRLLDERAWNEINSVQGLVIFTRDDSKFIMRVDLVAKTPEAQRLVLSERFDDVKPWKNDLIWGRSGGYEGVLDQSLRGVIRFDQHVLTQTSFGAAAKVPNGFTLYDWSGKKSDTFERIKIMGNRVAVRKNRAWYLMEPSSQKMESSAYDSLRSEGPFFVGLRGDSVAIHFDQNPPTYFLKPQRISFVPGKDSTSFLVVQHNGENSVFDLRGRKMFSAVFDDIEYAGHGVFVVTKRNRKGLVSGDGHRLLAGEFDAVGSANNGVVSLLKNKKFGAYDVVNRRFIRPDYERNVTPYANGIFMSFQGGFYGFSGWDNEPLSAVVFDEIKYWNDSVALVKQGLSWNFYDIHGRRFTETDLRSFTFIKDFADEKIAIVQKGDGFGVLSNRGKVIVPLTFTSVLNLGSTESPLYFTEKHIPEASLFVVIYYDASGTMIRKEIYDDAIDYDKIYCSDH